jgi:hypothetical protein
MATQVYRVSRVLTAAESPVARLQAIDEDGHELRLELPAALVGRTAPGHVLVLNWSVHALPVAPAAPVAADATPPASAAPPETPPASAARTVDEAFMDLMSRGRQGTSAPPPSNATTPPASQTRRGLEINDEFNTLLGAAQGRGSRDGR